MAKKTECAINEFRKSGSELVDRVRYQREHLIITKNGVPAVAMVSLEDYALIENAKKSKN